MLIQVETNHEKFSAPLRELDDLLKTTEQHDDATVPGVRMSSFLVSIM